MTDAELLHLLTGEMIEVPLEELESVTHDRPRLAALLEFARRWNRIPPARGDPVDSPRVLADRMRGRYRGAVREEFVVLLLDGQNRILREVTVSIGTQEAALVVPRDVLVEAIREAAAGVLFVHNHPSGNPLPSPEDVRVTRRLREVCALAGLRFLDHVIVGEAGYFSFAEEGM